MASSKEYVNFILEQCEGLTARAMMGEYVLYYGGKVVGGVYDNRLLVKVWLSNYPENFHPLDMRRFSSVRLCRDTFYSCPVPVPLLIPQLMDRCQIGRRHPHL